jgi:hypothetical protein
MIASRNMAIIAFREPSISIPTKETREIEILGIAPLR